MTQKITATINANQKYSSFKLPVSAGETYEFHCDGKQRWIDWFIKSSPRGFWNPLAKLAGLRVKKANCLCLCGCYNDQDYHAFPIGTGNVVTIAHSGFLSFFANDSAAHYRNNKGSVTLEIRRLPLP